MDARFRIVLQDTGYRVNTQIFQTQPETTPLSISPVMLPPVDPLVLSANPKFNALYSDLCNNKLNRDGTSKLEPKAQRDHDTVEEVFQSVHTNCTLCKSTLIGFRIYIKHVLKPRGEILLSPDSMSSRIDQRHYQKRFVTETGSETIARSLRHSSSNSWRS